MKKLRNKGFVVDILWLFLLIVSLVIGLIVFGFTTSTLSDNVFTQLDNESKEMYDDFTDASTGALDWVIPFTFVIYAVVIVGLTFIVRSNPAFAILLVLFAFLMVGVSFFFHDTIMTLLEQEVFDTALSNLPITAAIISALPIMMLVVAVMCTIFMFIKE
jgi:hypothetical protein